MRRCAAAVLVGVRRSPLRECVPLCRDQVILPSRATNKADDGEGQGCTVLHAARWLCRPLHVPCVLQMAGPLRWHGVAPLLYTPW